MSVQREEDFNVEDETTFEEQHQASERTLESRRLVGDLLGAFNGIREVVWKECRATLIKTEGDEAKARKICEDAFGAFGALIEAIGSDESKSQRRRMHLSAAQAEKYRRRLLVLPAGLSEEEKARQLDSWAHSWRTKSWRAVHRLQRVCHLPFFTKESDPFDPKNPNRSHKAAAYIDNLTDLLIAVRKSVKAQRRTVRRMDIAVARVLFDFRREVQHFCADPKRCRRPHPYAPEWSPGEDAPDANTKTAAEAEEDSPTVRVENIATRAALKAGKFVRELPADELNACAVLFLERASEAWLKATGSPLPFAPRCVTRADDENMGLAADPTSWVRASDENCDFAAKNDETASGNADNFSAGTAAVEVLEFEPEEEPRGVSMADADGAATACRSVGIEAVKVVVIDDTKERGTPGSCVMAVELSTEEFQSRLAEFLKRAPTESLTVRLRDADDSRLIQIDDCTREVKDLLTPFCFMAHQTSPGNWQVWVCLADDLTPEQYAEVRYRFLTFLKPTGANGGAYGSTRWPGSHNNKPKRRYADGEAPRVALSYVALGRRPSVAELDAAGLLAPPRRKPSDSEVRAIKSRLADPSDWPDMDYYLSVKGNRSDADAAWCVRALYMGHTPASVEAELERLSDKARVRRRSNYVRETVNKAAGWVGLNPRQNATPGVSSSTSERVRGTL
jgi:hypothetical protein